MDKELTVTETMNGTRVLAEVRPDPEVFWHLASRLLSYVKEYFLEREVLSETSPSPAARPLNLWVSRHLTQPASSDAASAETVMGGKDSPA